MSQGKKRKKYNISPKVIEKASACAQRRKKEYNILNTSSQKRTSRSNVGNLNSVRSNLGLQPTVSGITKDMEDLSLKKKGGKKRKKKRTRRKRSRTKKRKSKKRRRRKPKRK